MSREIAGGRNLPPKRKKRRKRRTKAQIEAAKERRMIREATAPGEGVTAEDRKIVYILYGKKCLACARTRGRIVLDHVVPLYEGGAHDPSNLQPLCWSCNKKKGTQTIDYRPWPYPY